MVGEGTEDGALPAVELGVGVCGATGCGVTAERSRPTSSFGGKDPAGSRHIFPGGATSAILWPLI